MTMGRDAAFAAADTAHEVFIPLAWKYVDATNAHNGVWKRLNNKRVFMPTDRKMVKCIMNTSKVTSLFGQSPTHLWAELKIFLVLMRNEPQQTRTCCTFIKELATHKINKPIE